MHYNTVGCIIVSSMSLSPLCTNLPMLYGVQVDCNEMCVHLLDNSPLITPTIAFGFLPHPICSGWGYPRWADYIIVIRQYMLQAIATAMQGVPGGNLLCLRCSLCCQQGTPEAGSR